MGVLSRRILIFFKKNVLYICGMSVPPIMMAQVATEVFNQWLSKI